MQNMSRQKIMQLVTLSETGGAQKVVYYLAAGLDREKFEVTVACGPGGELVVFGLGKESYGIDILSVHEIIRIPPIVKIPRTPGAMEGIINLRGQIVPVLSLRKCFGLEPEEETGNSRIVVVGIGGTTVGLVVDTVSEVLRLPDASIEPISAVFDKTDIDAAYIHGIGKLQDRLIILLNLERLLHAKELLALASSAEGAA